MPAMLDGPGLMSADMPGIRRNHALIRAQQRFYHDCIGLRSAGEKENLRFRAGAGHTDLLLGALAIAIHAIARRFFQVRLHQALQDERVRPFQIIAAKILPHRLHIFLPML